MTIAQKGKKSFEQMENNHPNIIFGYVKLEDHLRRKGNFGGITRSIVKYRSI